MSKDPAFLFYTSDFLTECTDLTMEERGQYITLICLQHQKGHLTKKIIDISVDNISPDVLRKFDTDDNGLFYNKRIEDVIEQRKKYTESRRKNGSLGGRPKKPYGLSYAKPYGKATENLPENENVNENFKLFIQEYPKKVNEDDYKYFLEALKKVSFNELIECVKNYAIYVEYEGIKEKYIKSAKSWLYGRYWQEYKDYNPYKVEGY